MSTRRIRDGLVVRVSEEAKVALETERLRQSETYDAVIRRLLGLADRRGNPAPMHFVLQGDLHETAAEARGTAILRAAKMRTKADCRVIRMRRLR